MNTFKTVTASRPKMKVEVWSDIMCPFCYIGKRNYEAALHQFEDSEQVDIEWHSFQLDPTIPKKMAVKENVYQYLAEKKGITYEQSAKMHQQLIQTAKKAGLEYNFDRAIVANSFDAHRMIQLAKTKGLGDQAEELLFHAYFTEGRDFGSRETLIAIGNKIGIPEEQTQRVLDSNEYAVEVENDIREAAEIGIQGVPFFVFDRKYAVSGAQPPEYFLQALNQSFEEWKTSHPASDLTAADGAICTPDGECK